MLLFGVLLLLPISISWAQECPLGSTYTPHRGKCLTAVPVPLNYRNAELSCALFDGRLAKIEHSEEYDLLFDHLTGRGVVMSKFWIGGTNVNTTWTWLDGKKFTFTRWDAKEPSSPEKENCLLVDGASKLWKSGDCDQKAQYICEMEPKTRNLDVSCEAQNCPECPICPEEPTCPPVSECPICPTTHQPITTISPPTSHYPSCPFHSYQQSYIPDVKWEVFEGYQYAISTVKRNFTDAEAGCAYFGGHLTSIHSTTEQTFVENLSVAKSIWIGGISTGNVELCWTDRTPWDYNKLSGQGGHSCVALVESNSERVWETKGCEEERYFICKRRYWG